MDENTFQNRRALADATRRLIRAVRLTQIDDEGLSATTAAIERAAEALEVDVFPGPHCQVGFDLANDFDLANPPERFFPLSPVVGPLNPVSPPLQVDIVDLAELGIEGPAVSATGKAVRGRVVLGEQYVGPPWDVVHGGVVAQVFDELLGLATIFGGGGGFTGRLTIHYRKPTPALKPLELVAWVERVSGRKLVARGEIRDEGTVTAEADGLFIRGRAQVEGQGPPPLAAVD